MNPIATLPSVVTTEQEQEEAPSASVIAQLKSQFHGRDLHRVEMTAKDGTSFVFVMTGPTRLEWKKYQDEIMKATGDHEKRIRSIEIAALAQIRWPDRSEVVAAFDANPGLVLNFVDTLNDVARVEMEVTTKKL